MAIELCDHDVKTLIEMFASKTLSPRELIKVVLERIDRFDSDVNAFSLVDREGAESAAAASEKRWHKGMPLGPLDGIPATIKDIVWTQDWPTTYGSQVLASEPAKQDAPCTARLKEAGAVLVGMTTTPELGWKAVTDSHLLGVTRNPWDCDKTPGGSSGGAAVAAALGLGNLHIGTDGGGSIRIPASFTGIVGHKPSFGRVPAYPMSAFGTVAHIGPMARNVADVALMLSVLSRPDSRDWYSLPPESEGLCHLDLSAGLKGLRIAYSGDLGYLDVNPEISLCVGRAARRFEEFGATVEQVDPGFDCPQEIFHRLWFSGAAHRLRGLSDAEKDQIDPGLAEIAELGGQYDLADWQEATVLRAELGTTMRRFHEHFDLLITPTTPIPAFKAGQEVPDPASGGRWTDWAGFSYPFNLTKQPACSIPCGFTSNGLPIGLQIVGSMFADAMVLRAAKAFEDSRQWKFPSEPQNVVAGAVSDARRHKTAPHRERALS